MSIRNYIWTCAVAMALIGPVMKAQEQITIGVIQYDVCDIDKSFKDLHEQGFGSCELNYSEKRFTKELAEQVKAASKKHRIRVTTLVGVPGSKVRGIFVKDRPRSAWYLPMSVPRSWTYTVK